MSASCEGPGSTDGPSLAGPRTPDDTGEADPGLAAAVARWADARDVVGQARVYAALPAARVFVPVVATLEEAEADPGTGLRAEKSSSMSVVTLVGASGATALPAFLSTAAMRRWRLDARPVPVSGREACLAALDGGHAAVVVDPAGARFPVEGPAMTALAEGWVPAAEGRGTAGLASRRVAAGLRFSPAAEPLPAAARDALVAALADEPAVAEAHLLDAAVGDEPPARTLALVLAQQVPADQVPADEVAADEVAAVAARLQQRLLAAGTPVALDLAVLNAAQRRQLADPPLWSATGPGPTGRRGSWWRRRGRARA